MLYVICACEVYFLKMCPGYNSVCVYVATHSSDRSWAAQGKRKISKTSDISTPWSLREENTRKKKQRRVSSLGLCGNKRLIRRLTEPPVKFHGGGGGARLKVMLHHLK